MRPSRLPLAACLLLLLLGLAYPNISPAQGTNLIWIPPGTFLMGSPTNDPDAGAWEQPQHSVTITRGFWMNRYEVTQGEFGAMFGSNPGADDGNPSVPARGVTWEECVRYCDLLTERERAAGLLPAGFAYRLPTEAEWEYACRAGSSTRFSYGDDPAYSSLPNYAAYAGDTPGLHYPQAIGQRLPNPWGLEDIHGNVAEFCLDWFGNYAANPLADPHGPAAGPGRVEKGGASFSTGPECRSAARGWIPSNGRNYGVGLRVVLAAEAPRLLLARIGFEAPEGYTAGLPLGGAHGWYEVIAPGRVAPGGNGVATGLLPNSVQQGFLGGVPGSTTTDTNGFATFSYVGRNLFYQPAASAPGELDISWTQLITDSTNGARNYFEWAFYNHQGRLLGGLNFANDSGVVSRRLEDSSALDTGLRFARGQPYAIKLRFNFAENFWTASIGTNVLPVQPITTNGLALTLGSANASWWGWVGQAPFPGGPVAGDNLMAFDDLTVAASAPDRMEWITPGGFAMGSPASEAGRDPKEGPQTQVTLTHGFWMSQYEVSQADYLTLAGGNPSQFTGDLTRPVERVSWFDASSYCEKLTTQERAAGRLPDGFVYRLPTEAEWEYACRAGTTNRWSFGNTASQLTNYGWFIGNSGCQPATDPTCASTGSTHPVGQKLPNPWGLFDMHGNAAEWVLDWYAPYPGGARTDWLGPSFGTQKILRAPAWDFGDIYSRSAGRWGVTTPLSADNSIGFRVVLAPAASPGGEVVYSTGFESGAGPEWSSTMVSVTPSGGRRFLGEFSNQTINLSLSNLPPHTVASVEFEVYVLRSWDGNATGPGPDVWSLQVAGGPVLTRTTFGSGHPYSISSGQAFPGSFPGATYPARSGATELNSLGYTFSDAAISGSMDAVYHLGFTFPHTGTNLSLNFAGSGLQAVTDESWGLDDVMVSLFTNTAGVVAFSTPAVVVAENATSAVISVSRVGGASGAITVDYFTSDSTATAGSDYTAVKGTLSFADGETNKTIQVPIVDDSVVESTESFAISLNNPTGGAALGSLASIPVQILDNDGVIQLSQTNFLVAECSAGLYIPINWTGVTNNSVTVQYSTHDGTATAGSDYFTASGTFTIPAGQTNGNLFIYINDDSLVEPEENFTLTLSNPGGTGANLGGQTNAVITILDNDGPLGAGPGVNWQVEALLVQPDGKLLIGGGFTQIHATGRTSIARLTADGSVDTTFNPGSGANNWVEGIALQPDGKVVIGGSFTAYNGTARNRIARLNSDGTLDTAFNPGTGANNTVYKMAVQPDGKLVIVGLFTSVGGVARNRVARLNADGTLDGTFNPGTGANNTIFALALQSDGRIVVSGAFTTFNGTPLARLARLSPTGAVDATFNVGVGMNARANVIIPLADDSLLLGGLFTTINGGLANRLARLTPNGTLDPTFNAGGGPDSTVWALALQPDGKLLVGGDWSHWKGVGQGHLARVNTNGTLDTTFAVGYGANNYVGAVAALPDGRVAAAGNFTVLNGFNRYRFALLGADGSLPEEPMVQVQWAVANGGNDHWYALTSRPATWTNAEAQAASLGGHLVAVNSAGEESFLETAFLKGLNRIRPLWIGFSDAAKEGTFVWSTGDPSGYTNWLTGEPNNSGGNENYAVLNWQYSYSSSSLPAAARFAAWNDVPTNGTFASSQADGPYFGIIELASTSFPPSFVLSPQSLTSRVTSTVTFSALATNGLVGYQWLVNNTILPGATNSMLQITNLVFAQNGTTVAVVASNQSGSVTSAVAVLTVQARPTITVQPQSQTVVAGGSVSFFCEATGTTPMGFRWRKNSANFTNGIIVATPTNSTLTLTNIPFAFNGAQFTVGVTNVLGPAPLSSNATLTVLSPPIITNQPVSQAVSVGGSVTFSVTAGGSVPLFYQWLLNGSKVLNGATNASLTLLNVQPTDTGNYSVVIDNLAGAVISAETSLGVQGTGFCPRIGPAVGGGTDRVYQDGYVRVDVSGNAGGLTWFWGYTSASQVPGDGYIYFHCSGMSNSSFITITDRYALNGVVPPSAPYNGTFSGPGPLISDSPTRNLGASDCLPPPPGLLAWWRGEGNAGDALGLHKGARVQGAAFATGKVGQAFALNGLGAYIDVGPLNLPSTFTISAWIWPSNLDDTPIIIAEDDGAADRSFYFAIEPAGSLVGSVAADGLPIPYTQYRTGPGAVSLNEWQLVTLTYDGGVGANQKMGFYVNGARVSASHISSFDSGGAPRQTALADTIGISGDGLSNPYDGLIDEMMLFGRSLTSNEIASIFTADAAGLCLPEETPVGLPLVLINSQIPSTNSVTITNSALFEFVSAFTNAHLYYSLDGSDPAAGLLYTTPFILTQSAVVRAVAYSADYVQSAQADPVTVKLLAAPLITQQPQSQLVAAHTPVLLSVSATGTQPLVYQWASNGIPISGATADTLFFANPHLSDSGLYSVTVSNAAGFVFSDAATLTVLAPLGFNSPLPSADVGVGASAGFCVDATGGGPLSFQWRKNGVNLPGATNSCYPIHIVQASDGGAYSVIIANLTGTASSDTASLTVHVPEVPPGDNFSDRVAIAGDSGYAAGTNFFATREAGEPYHAGKLGSNSVWYTWHAPASGIAAFATSGSTFDTLLAIYTNDLSANPQPSIQNLVAVAANDDDLGGFLTSLVRFNAGAGVDYQVAIDGFADGQGRFILGWQLDALGQVLPIITVQPSSQTVTQGMDVTFSVAATGSGLSFQWFLEGQSLPARTNSNLVLLAVQATDVGAYTVRITDNQAQTIETQPAYLEIGPVAGVQSQDKIEDLFPLPSLGAPFQARASAAGSVSFVSVAAGTLQTQIFTTTNSTTQAPETNSCGVIGGSSRWFLLQAATNGTLLIDTSGSSFDTLLAVFTGTSFSTLSLLDCNNDAAPGITWSRVSVAASAGAQYLVAVDGVKGSNGIVHLNWGLGSAPSNPQPVTPLNLLARTGGSLSLSTPAIGAPGPNYQWLFNQTNLAGATNTTLVLTNLQAFHAGTYSVVVSNFLGTLINPVATVEVDPSLLTMAQSGFDHDAEGWSLGAGTEVALFRAANGNPGGYLSATNQDWLAPQKYLGNQSAGYGGLLQFDLQQNTLPSQAEDADIFLTGGGLTLCYRATKTPGPGWISYRVALHEAAGWRKDSLTGPAPSQAEMLETLAALTELSIRTLSGSPQQSGGLDNVALLAPPANNSVLLAGRRIANQLTFEWPSTASGFRVQTATTLSPPDWVDLPASPIPVNALNTLSLSLTNGGRFYRLTK